MMVLLRDLPPGIVESQLRGAIGQAIRRLPLARIRYRPEVRGIKILKVQDEDGKTLRYHGLMHITPPAFAQRLLKRVPVLVMGARKVTLVPYVRRERDRRIAYTDPRLLPFRDRRQGERRRLNLRPIR